MSNISKLKFSFFVLLLCSAHVYGQSTSKPAGSGKAGKASESAETSAADDAAEMVKVLIVDGQNNHTDWPKTTIMMKQFLEDTGKFSVDVARTATTWKGKLCKDFPLEDGKERKDLKKPKTDPDYSPKFSSYDVVISNFGNSAAPWPEETKANFEKFMAEGGGLVVVHAADNSWGDWKEFNEMIGLGGWGGRKATEGEYVYIDDEGDEQRDAKKGKKVGDHGPQREYQVVCRKPDHPIMEGLPQAWLHAKDELYQYLRGPAENMTILATSYADPKYKGTGRHEPSVMVLDYKDGRVFHTILGHADYSMECVGFTTLLIRGTEWAATGKVTSGVPEDFPTDKESSSRTFEREMQPSK